MNEQSIQEQYQTIIELLSKKQLKEAQFQLQAFIWSLNDSVLHNRLEQVQTSYQYLLQYMKQGMNDPERSKLHTRLLAETWEIADQARINLLDEVSNRYYNSLHSNGKRRTEVMDMSAMLKVLESFSDEMAVYKLLPDNEAQLKSILFRHEETNKYLFLTTWGNSAWNAEEEQQAMTYLDSEILSFVDLSLFTSAVTLSLIECFDMRKFSWLLAAYAHANVNINQRALIGIVLVLHFHPNRIELYPDLTARLSLLNEDGHFGKQLNRIYLQLLLSKETEKIDKIIREDIIPGVMKSVRNQKFGFEESNDDNDLNPDWEKHLEESGIGEKIREMNELQQEGADIYMSSFAHLKGYPFFREPHNWFYPFYKEHSSVIHELNNKEMKENVILSFILYSGLFCNSDKYSLCFTMAQIPASHRSMMINQMTSQNLNEQMGTSQLSAMQQHSTKAEVVSKQYIHDLYRFFKLCQRKNEYRDIFKEAIVLHRIPALKEILCKPELLKDIANFNFYKEHRAEALDAYQELIAMNYANADMFQKIGYCLQKEKRYQEAIQAYRKADALKPDHVWTIRHLATCYRQTKDYTAALEYYKKAEAVQPENQNILFFVGSCLAEQERYDEALQYFFKLDFLEANNRKTWRAIAWCSFMAGKHEQAMKYYDKILTEKPLAIDYLNAGHASWVVGKLDKAIELYSRASAQCESHKVFIELFHKDTDSLLKQGMKKEEIPLVLDMVEVMPK